MLNIFRSRSWKNTKIFPYSKPIEPKTEKYHKGVGAGRRTALQQGGVGQGRSGCQRVSPPRKQLSLLLSKASKTTVMHVFLESRPNEILCKPMEEHNERLTRVLSAAFGI